MIFVSDCSEFRRNELMPGDARHCVYHALVADAARDQLRLDHSRTFSRKEVGLEVRRHQRTAYFFRWRTLTSKPSTPFLSRITTIEKFLFTWYSAWMTCCADEDKFVM